MTITVEIPEKLARLLMAAGQDPARTAPEAIALEGYRSDRLSAAEIRRLLGVASPVARRAQSEDREPPSDERRAG